jgi:CTP synthase
MGKWIFITGGVLSGLGKGLVSASLAKLLESRGYDVVPIKCDGYLNVDPGTMNPHEHGEVFVLEDGGEVDMDFGHYERFLDINGRSDWNLTSGKIFRTVIDKERQGDYLGETVQMIPHVTDEVKSRFRAIADREDADITIVEIGGTVGDIENMLYLEAVRQLWSEEDSVLMHVTLVPFLDTVGEQKTKPTQHSVKDLQEAGLRPDIIVGRSEERLDDAARDKISLFCDVDTDDVISNPDTDNIYKIPLIFEEQDLDRQVLDKLQLDAGDADLQQWKDLVANMEDPDETLTIALAGKYTDMDDSYVSIEEALRHAGANLGKNVDTELVDTTDPDMDLIQDADGVVIPGGFGSRGVEGKLQVARYCRENQKPLLGICFGMQMMVIEYAQNVCNLEDAHSTEIEPETPDPVIAMLPEQEGIDEKGGTMRLGAYRADIDPDTHIYRLYGSNSAVERHRHRYEVNPDYHDILHEHGLRFSGTSKESRLAEYMEIDDHPFYIGTQAHPEFNSRLESPNPLYTGLLRAAGE